MPNPPRGCSYLYGHGAVEPFLKANDLVGMIRAHQCKEEGVGFAYTDNRVIDYKFPYITTVFTASNYCGTHGNKAAVMVFLKDDIQVSDREGGRSSSPSDSYAASPVHRYLSLQYFL